MMFDTIIRCWKCRKGYDVPITEDQVKRWRAGAFIQDVAPELTPGQRELLISKTCDTCFDDMFKEED